LPRLHVACALTLSLSLQAVKSGLIKSAAKKLVEEEEEEEEEDEVPVTPAAVKTPLVPESPAGGGNWVCDCGFDDNYPERTECFSCEKARPAAAEPDIYQSPAVADLEERKKMIARPDSASTPKGMRKSSTSLAIPSPMGLPKKDSLQADKDAAKP